MTQLSDPCRETADIACPRVLLPDITLAFHESPRPVLMPESYLLDLLSNASGGKIRVRPRYVRKFRTEDARRRGRTHLLLLFFAHRAPLGYLQEFLLELAGYRGDDDWMLRLQGALQEFMREEEEIHGRSLGHSMMLLHAIRTGQRNPDLEQAWSGHHSLLAEYFGGPALLRRLRRDRLLSDRDDEILRDLALAGSVDEARCDVLTQTIRLQCVPWRDSVVVHFWDPPNKGSSITVPVLDRLIELLWGDLTVVPDMLTSFAQPDESPEELRDRLRFLLQEVAALDVSAYHVLNPGFAYFPPRDLNLAMVRSVGRDGVNTFILVVLKGDRVIKRSLVPTHIHPTVLDFRMKPPETTPRAIQEITASWGNLEDARLDMFQDPKDGRYRLLITYVVASGAPMPLLESTTIDVEKLIDFMDDQPSMEVDEWSGLEVIPKDLRKIETQHARLVVANHRERVRLGGGGRDKIFVTDPVHPLLIPENREALVDLGVPPEIYEDPEACVKDASRSRQQMRFGRGDVREVDIWEFRSKRGGHRFLTAPDYAGRFLHPDPSWIGRVALDPVTSEIIAVPVMCLDDRWMFRPYLISEDRFAWIGGSSQRDVVAMTVADPTSGAPRSLKVGLNVIHTTEEVPVATLPYWLQPTRPQPRIALYKYELRITLELNPWDPFAEPILYPGTAATPRRLEDWVGWVGRVKFNNNFSVRTVRTTVRPGEEPEDRTIFEFLMAGGDHVVQHTWCDFEALAPLKLPWNDRGKLEMSPPTPFINPQNGERFHIGR